MYAAHDLELASSIYCAKFCNLTLKEALILRCKDVVSTTTGVTELDRDFAESDHYTNETAIPRV